MSFWLNESSNSNASPPSPWFPSPWFLQNVLSDGMEVRSMLVNFINGVFLESGFLGAEGENNPILNSLSYFLPGQDISLTICKPKIMVTLSVNNAALNLRSFILQGPEPRREHLLFFSTNDLNDFSASFHGALHLDRFGRSRDSEALYKYYCMVKGRLILPLYSDMWEMDIMRPVGLDQLPKEILLSILNSDALDGYDLARIACTCTKVKDVAYNEELWKKKFENENGFNWLLGFEVTWKVKSETMVQVHHGPV